MLPAKVIMSYGNLVSAFESISDEANCGIVLKVQDPCACFRSERNGRASFECLIHCKNWKWKSATASKHKTKVVNIVIAARERIRRRDLALLSSVVQVNYFEVNNAQARLLQAFHYDYDPCQQNHALFHAQVSDDMIGLSKSDSEALGIDFALPEKVTETRHRSVRIPTCDMTFSSVLVSLVADHMEGLFFRKFRDIASEHQKEMPLPLIRKLCRSLKADTKDFRSSHWYCHTMRN
jgi:hypothetical protein